MKQIFWIMIFFASLTPLQGMAAADAAAKPCTSNCFEKYAIPLMKKSVVESVPLPNADSQCPAAGSELIEDVEKGSSGVLSSESTITGLIAKSSSQRAVLEADKSKCGPCSQQNIVSSFTTSAPASLRTDVVCDATFATNTRGDMDNGDVKKYADDILQGRNAFGQKVHSACTTSCSFYVASAQTALTPTSSRINLTIFCGPPRKGSILFATYNFSVGFVHQWTCKK